MRLLKDSLSEFSSTYGDGLSFMDNYHLGTNSDIIQKLTGENIVGVTEAAALNNATVVENEHSYNLDPNAPAGRYMASMNAKAGRPLAQGPSIRKALSVSKEEYSDMFKGSTLLPTPEDMLKNRFNRFNRYGYMDLAHEFVSGTREYLFFSKPDLHLMNPDGTLYDPLQSNPFLIEAYKHYRYSFYCLQQYFGSNTSISGDSSTESGEGMIFDIRNKYIPMLSNMVTSTLDLPDITAGDVEGNRNLYQVNTSYREGSLASDLQYEFSLEFKDTKYLDVYMMFKTYDEYHRHKYYAEIEPTREQYITSKIYPEALSIWKIIVDDSDRILYWAKVIGTTPMSVPRGAISNIENQIKLTVNWKAQFVRDMDPINLMELNHLTALSLGKDTIGDVSIALPSDGDTWVGYPMIISADNGSKFNTVSRTGDNNLNPQNFYKLVWVK